LFDDLDATSTPPSRGQPGSATRTIDDSDDDDDSSLTSLSDIDFEDVPLPQPKRQKVEPEPELSDSDEEELEFEDVHNFHFEVDDAPTVAADLELTLATDPTVSLENMYGKKGPSKQDRKRRITTHCVHVMFLMWHNAVRNSWLCDPEVQGLLISQLPAGLWEEVDRWRRNSGLEVLAEPEKKKPAVRKTKGKGRTRAAPNKASRDWDQAAQRLERGAVDLSHGDPLFRLMKALSAWWKKRFRVTAPGLRKRGYMSAERLGRLTKAYGKEEHDPTRFGERIESLEEFRRRAQECSGSRDVGAQLFTALLRGLGLEARMVANIQPVGFGWNKLEEADPEKQGSNATGTSAGASASDAQPAKVTPAQRKTVPKPSRRKSTRKPPAFEEERSFELKADDSDDDVVEIMVSTAKKGPVYDKDLEFPHYWTEVLSPVTRKYLSVDPIVKSVVATNRDLVESLEPRGAKADRARQVMAYVVGYSQDGTAKDVTVRYLKKQVFPGRTKGMRIPTEKIPVYNRHGKVKRYDQYDWFRAVMRGYSRGSKDRPITEVDEDEQVTDLTPKLPQKKEVKEGEETLQYYKQSKEFVLERHLKREEAILPTAKPVKTFSNKGKGDEEPVYSRKDVVQVKSAETWHKQGRAPLRGEQPLKRVPYRAATTNRRREIAEAEAATGEKVLQGLYSFDQTDWIIPDPIKDGVIPKNDYGNIDLFAEHMCPKGAVHVPYRGAMRVCKRLEIDYAEAVVGFEFGNRMAVPVIQGVVIAEEHHDRVMEEVAKDEAERSRKEDEKRRKVALNMWRKMLLTMRIGDRIEKEYGHIKDDVRAFTNKTGANTHADEEMAGGFLPEGYDQDDEDQEAHQRSGFFPVGDDEDGDDDGDGGLQVEYGGGGFEVPSLAYPTPQSGLGAAPEVEEEPAPRLRVAKPRASKSKPLSTRRRRRRAQPSSDEEDEEEEDEEPDEESDEDYGE
jgi:xeroderma pigmentosum group C-complementing protein